MGMEMGQSFYKLMYKSNSKITVIDSPRETIDQANSNENDVDFERVEFTDWFSLTFQNLNLLKFR